MTGHIFIEGEIGDGYITTSSVRNNISDYPQATDWNIHINSGGGDVDEGYAIGSILANLPKTTAIIGATCASIATYAALRCDHVIMGPAGDFLIHLPTAVIGGNASDHRAAADRLDRIKAELQGLYMKRVAKKGITAQQVSDMIDKETSMSPSEALAMGFVDEVQERFKAVAKIDIKKFNMTNNNEEIKGLFAALSAKIDKWFKPKNAILPVTLTDGTVLTVNADDPNNLQGAGATMQDGTPCADGVYETVDGSELTIAGGVITEVETEPVNDDQPDAPDMKAQELEKQIADLQAQLTAKNAESALKDKEVSEAKTQLQNIGKEFTDLKTKTFGNPNPPAAKPDAQFNNQDDNDGGGLWGQHIVQHIKSRHLIEEDK